MRYFNLFLIIPILLFVSCTQDNKHTNTDVYFFSLKTYFEQEAENLQNQNLKIIRTSRIDNKISSATDTAPDWKTEFNVFKSLDISNPKLSGNFATDSVINENNRHLLYENISGKGKVQTVHIMMDKNNIPTLIEVKTFEDNYFKKEELTYSYQPSQAIGLMGARKSFLSDEMEIEVLAEIGRK